MQKYEDLVDNYKYIEDLIIRLAPYNLPGTSIKFSYNLADVKITFK